MDWLQPRVCSQQNLPRIACILFCNIHYPNPTLIYLRLQQPLYPGQCRGGSEACPGNTSCEVEAFHQSTKGNVHILIHTEQEFSIAISPVSCFWEVGRNPQGVHVNLHTESNPSLGSNQGPWFGETAIVPTAPACISRPIQTHLFS